MIISGVLIGVLLVAIGCTWWKVRRAQKSQPYILLLGSCVLTGTALSGFFQDSFAVGASTVASVVDKGAKIGIGGALLVTAVVLSIFLYHGMHPRNGAFNKSTKILALITPSVWIATGGFFATAVGWLSTVAKHAGDAANLLGK